MLPDGFLSQVLDQYNRFHVIGANLEASAAREAIPDFRRVKKLSKESQIRHAYKFLGTQTTGGDVHRALEVT